MWNLAPRSAARTAQANARALRVGAEFRQGARGSINSFGLILAIGFAFAFALLAIAPGATQKILTVQASTPGELIIHVLSLMVGAEGASPAALLWLVAGIGVFACQRSAGKTAHEPKFRGELEKARISEVLGEHHMIGGDGGIAVGRIDVHAFTRPSKGLPVDRASAIHLSALAQAAKRVLSSTLHSTSSLRARATA